MLDNKLGEYLIEKMVDLVIIINAICMDGLKFSATCVLVMWLRCDCLCQISCDFVKESKPIE